MASLGWDDLGEQTTEAEPGWEEGGSVATAHCQQLSPANSQVHPLAGLPVNGCTCF